VEGIGYRKQRRNSESKSFDPDESYTSDSETKGSQTATESETSSDGLATRRTVSTEVNTVLRKILDARGRASCSRTLQLHERKAGLSDFEGASGDEEKAHEIFPPSPLSSLGVGRRRPTVETPYQESGEFYLQRVVAPPLAEEEPLNSFQSDFLGRALDRISTAYLASPYRKSSPLQLQEPLPVYGPNAPRNGVRQKQEPLPVSAEVKEEENKEVVLDPRWNRGRPRSIAVVESSPIQHQLAAEPDPGRRSMAPLSLLKEPDDFQPGSAPLKPEIKLRLMCEFDPPSADEQKPPDHNEEKRAAFDSFIVHSRGGPGYDQLHDRRISI